VPNYTPRFYGNNFDSVIYQDLTMGTHEYILALLLRVWLRQENPPPGRDKFYAMDTDKNTATAVQWGADEWEQFKKEFKRQAYAAWNDAFVLIPPAKFDGFVDPEGVRRRVRCFLEIQLVDSGAPNVHTVDVARLANPGDWLRANADSGPGDIPGHFTSNDLKPVTRTGPYMQPIKTRMVNGKLRYSGGDPSGRTYAWQQHVLPHEVGHMLGLNHVNQASPACDRSANSPPCYGVWGSQVVNIMGGGDALDLQNAEP